jgi:O-antigen/teichoic acid export membrane protein
MTLGVVASLGLELAIPICLADIDYANLLALCGIALAGTTTTVGLMCWLVPARALTEISLGSLASYRYLLPIGLVWLGGYYIVVAAATRAATFREIAGTRISQGLTGPLSQLVLGVLGAGTPGLIIGYVIGQSSGTVLLLSRIIRRQRDLLRRISWRGIAIVAHRYAGFLVYASWARLLDMADGMALFLLFAALYSSDAVGFMFLSERVIMRPLTIVSTSLLQVFTGEAGRAVSQDPAQLRRRFYQVVPRLFALAAASIMLGNLVATWAFPLFFGAAWAGAIPYLRALSLAGVLQAVLHPVSTTLQMLEYQLTAAAWQIGRLALVIAGVWLPWRAGLSAVGTLWIVSSVEAGCCLLLLALMLWAIEQTVARHPLNNDGGGGSTSGYRKVMLPSRSHPRRQPRPGP